MGFGQSLKIKQKVKTRTIFKKPKLKQHSILLQICNVAFHNAHYIYI